MNLNTQDKTLLNLCWLKYFSMMAKSSVTMLLNPIWTSLTTCLQVIELIYSLVPRHQSLLTLVLHGGLIGSDEAYA